MDQAVGQLPEGIAAGHRVGTTRRWCAGRCRCQLTPPGARGSCPTRGPAHRLRGGGPSNASIHTALSRVAFDDEVWQPALRQDGDQRPGAAVAEPTGQVDLTDWPEGTRLIVRREPLHPGAPQSLFASTMFRYWGHYTEATGGAVDLDVHMRAHAHVEDNIRRLKDSGALRVPFTDIDANRAWLAVVCFADALVRWFQQLCLTGPLAVAEPKTLRWGCGTPPPGSCAAPADRSCASSTAGPAPRRCSTRTNASPRSPDRPHRRARRHHARDTRPDTPRTGPLNQ